MRFLFAAALALGLAACDQQPSKNTGPQTVAVTGTPPSPVSPPPPSATPQAVPTVPAMSAPVLTPEAEKGEKGARNVLIEWARSVEQRDFARAAALWDETAPMSAAAHRARFGPLGRTTVSIGEGAVEGAAGSLYYAVPVTVAGSGRTLSGEIVARRVNDVDGATPAQLRWHVERLDLKP